MTYTDLNTTQEIREAQLKGETVESFNYHEPNAEWKEVYLCDKVDVENLRYRKRGKTLKDIRRSRVYISGKMTGLAMDEILDKFGSVEKELLEGDKGNAVMNPAIMWYLKDTTPFSAQDYLHIDFAMMDLCDTVIVLPNFRTSSGAKKEIMYAKIKNMTLYFLQEDGALLDAEELIYENVQA